MYMLPHTIYLCLFRHTGLGRHYEPLCCFLGSRTWRTCMAHHPNKHGSTPFQTPGMGGCVPLPFLLPACRSSLLPFLQDGWRHARRSVSVCSCAWKTPTGFLPSWRTPHACLTCHSLHLCHVHYVSTNHTLTIRTYIPCHYNTLPCLPHIADIYLPCQHPSPPHARATTAGYCLAEHTMDMGLPFILPTSFWTWLPIPAVRVSHAAGWGLLYLLLAVTL